MSGETITLSADQLRVLLTEAGATKTWNESYIDKFGGRFWFTPDAFTDAHVETPEDKARIAARDFVRECRAWLADFEARERILETVLQKAKRRGVGCSNGSIIDFNRLHMEKIRACIEATSMLPFYNNFHRPKSWHYYASYFVLFYWNATDTKTCSAEGPCARFVRLALAAAGMKKGLPSLSAIAKVAEKDQNLQAFAKQTAAERIARLEWSDQRAQGQVTQDT